MKLTVVSGLSGAGKSVAMDALEDAGCYCVDNLPIALLLPFTTRLDVARQPAYANSAVAIDARNPPEALRKLPSLLGELRARDIVQWIIFLEASDASLMRRFSETRRKHPLTAPTVSLAEAIRAEREVLGAVREMADACIDTSRTHLHQLRATIRERFTGAARRGVLALVFESFGYKFGVPPDADLVFDARCLPNPYWEARLRTLDGRHEAVAAFLEASDDVRAMIGSIGDYLERWIPCFQSERRAYLTVAIGCTGGQHRSVFVAERLAAAFRNRDGLNVLVRHRELGGPAAPTT